MKIIKLLCFLVLFSSCEGFKTKQKPFPLQMQATPQECGPACLKMISDFFGSEYTFETIALLCKMNEIEGTSLGDVANAAEIIGLHTLAVSIDYQTLLDEVPYPAILHWDNHHFVVIYKMTKDKIWIADPAKGYVAYTKEEFLPHWIHAHEDEELKEGYALLLETTDTFFDPRTKIKAHIKSRLEHKKKDNAILQLQSQDE